MKKIAILLSLLIFSCACCLLIFAIDQSDIENDIPTDTNLPHVYVSNNGNDTNDGQSDSSPVASLEKAYNLLKDTGGIVVICGKLTLSDSAIFPSNDKEISITSYYEGTDYKSLNNAEIFFDDTLNITGKGTTHFYGIRLHSSTKASIYCNGSNVKFGARIENKSDDASYPSVFGGRYLDGSNKDEDGIFSDYSITVDTGYWHSVTLGNYRSCESAPMSTISNATLQINGGTFLANDGDVLTTSAVSSAKVSDKISLEINGGIFYGSVYAIGNEGKLHPFQDKIYDADVNVKITNGTFSGKYIKALYAEDATLNGTYTFIAEGGSYSNLTYVGCEGVKGKIELTSCEAVQNKLYGFEKVIYLSKNGNDEYSGESPATAKKTVSGAFAALQSGGSIVLCSDFSLNDGFTTRTSNQKIRITSQYFDTDYSKESNAVLNISGNINLRSDITFDNISIKTASSATFSCYGSHIEFGENVRTEGDIALVLKQNEKSHTFSMSSGSFSMFDFESSDVSTFISITGGSIDMFRGCNNMHIGDIFVDFSGGSINGDISIAPKGITGNLQLIVGNCQIKGNISTQRPDTDKLCEALVVYNYDRAKLNGFDIIEDNYVFVMDGASGNGSTPSLAAPTIDAALAYLGNSNACVVFCGKTTYNNDYSPKNIGIITYSSVYRNINFESINNAQLVLEKDYYFDNDATIQDLKLVTNKKNISFHCNGNIVVFGYGISCDIPFVNSEYYPSIIANDNIPEAPFNDKGESLSDKISIKGGVWNNVYSSAATDILGGIIHGSLFGTNDLSNNCSITISNGVIYGGIYASVSAKDNSTSYITITINGGELHGIISPSLSPSTGYEGQFLINISGGDFSGIDSIKDAAYIGGDKSFVNIKDDIDMNSVSDNTSVYKNPISNNLSALSFYDGQWFLAEVNSGILSLYSSNSINAINKHNPIYTHDFGDKICDISISINDGTMYIFSQILHEAQNETTVLISESLDIENISFKLLNSKEIKPFVSPAIYTYGGEKYIYFSQYSENASKIYCAKVDKGLNLLSDPVLVLQADNKWENQYLTTPRMITAPDGKVYISYTGGNIFDGSSMIGIASIETSNLLDPESYHKNPDPIFYETTSHRNLILATVIQIQGASEDFLVYSSRVNGQYSLIMQSYSYDKDNTPYFSVPCDINMQYLTYHQPKPLSELLTNFNVKPTDSVPNNSLISKGFSFIELLKENYLIILVCFFVIMLVVVLLVIKKFSEDPQSQFKRNQKERSRNDRRRASRLNVGREYAANLQRLSDAENESQKHTDTAETEMNEDDNVSTPEIDNLVNTDQISDEVKDISEISDSNVHSELDKDPISVNEVTPKTTQENTEINLEANVSEEEPITKHDDETTFEDNLDDTFTNDTQTDLTPKKKHRRVTRRL